MGGVGGAAIGCVWAGLQWGGGGVVGSIVPSIGTTVGIVVGTAIGGGLGASVGGGGAIIGGCFG